LFTRWIAIGVVAVLTMAALPAGFAQVAPASAELAPVRRVVDDYIGFYTKERLPEWKTLFLPSFTATYTNADGTVSVRSLEQFYESQRAGFAKGPMSETLHDVRITREGRLAHAFAGFDFTSGGSTRRGQLMLLLIESKSEFRIAALTFSYSQP
jgi:hypothetical protein